jgi:hypothetical protein
MVENLNTVIIGHGILTLENVGFAVNYLSILVTFVTGLIHRNERI